MVNGPLLRTAAAQRNGGKVPRQRGGGTNRLRLEMARKMIARPFAQILGKFYFFNLRENLQHILLDYEEKRSCTTNGAFKSAC
jgi:hypothetical protein